jgi:hypothetical protein
MTVVSLVDAQGNEEPLGEADDAFDRFLHQVYRSLHPSTRAFIDLHAQKAPLHALYRTAPHRALVQSAVALYRTGLLKHLVELTWPLLTHVRELLLDTLAFAAAPLAFAGAFVLGQAVPWERYQAVQSHDRRKLAPPRPLVANVALYFGVPCALLLGRDWLQVGAIKFLGAVLGVSDNTNNGGSGGEVAARALVGALVTSVALYQGLWSALRLKHVQHAWFFGEERRFFDVVRQVGDAVVRTNQLHVTQRTRRRALIALNLVLSSMLAWRHFWWLKRFHPAAVTSPPLAAATLASVVCFHWRNGIIG